MAEFNDDEQLKYSDIIRPDDSIDKLISQLTDLSSTFESVISSIKGNAEKMSSSLKQISGASSEGRKNLDDMAIAAARLEKAQSELRIAMSDTGKQIAWLKAQTSDTNKATVEQERYLREASTSYNKLRLELKQCVDTYKSLTHEERANSQIGTQLLEDILALKNQIRALDDTMKPHIRTVSDLEKAEKRLAYMQSEEGQRLLEIQAKIRELSNARKQQANSADSIAKAQERLLYAQSEENEQLKLYSTRIAEANRIAQLQAIIASSAEGSYNRLSAQYSLNKIRLNQMSAAEREAADSGKKLEMETNAIYQQMIKLQEATGNYRLSVGHYQRAWDGLGISITQVVRELPSLAVSLNTFFLGISNNIPMLVDEIIKLRAQNKLLAAEGKETINVTGKILKSLFGWNTVLVVLLTVLSMFGKQIANSIASLLKLNKAALSTNKAMANIAEELKNSNDNYGDSIVLVKKLSSEWNALKTTAEKNQWIKDNTSEFNKLGISIKDVNDATNAFIYNTPNLIEALKLRAKAAVAQKLAESKYEESFQTQVKAEAEEAMVEEGKTPFWSKVLSVFVQGATTEIPLEQRPDVNAESIAQSSIDRLKERSKAIEKEADKYFEIYQQLNDSADYLLESAGISLLHKSDKTRARRPRDLTDTIYKNEIEIKKKYEESITKLEENEYAKRKKDAEDQIVDANNRLREMYRKNEEYVNNVEGKYKELTEEQKKQISLQQNWITSTIDNNLKYLQRQLKKIENEQKANTEKVIRSNTISKIPSIPESDLMPSAGISIDQRTQYIEKSLAKERDILLESLKYEYDLILESNKDLLDQQSEYARSNEEILEEFKKKELSIISEYDKRILELRLTNIDNELEFVKKGTQEELDLLLKRNELRMQLEQTENIAKSPEQQVSTSVISDKYSKSAKQITGQFELTELEQQQALDEAVFNEIKRSEKEITLLKLQQEKKRWELQIKLAEEGALEWSDAQIETAKSTIKRIEREIKELNDFINNIGDKGLVGGLLSSLGFDDKAINAFSDAVNIIVDNLKEIADAEIELAEKSVEAANKRVEAAEESYKAEIETRNNGYASNVANSKRELQREKENLKQKQKLLEEAQARKDRLDTISQTSSLITASALLWSSMAGVPVIGPTLAVAAIAAMWASFIAAKSKAKQVTSQSQEYGEGGLEFLEGGSHASGNDIDLGVNNSKNRKMKAEGGEALAIINRRRTKKYRAILPDIVDSLNKGVFEEKYVKAFDSASTCINNYISSSINLATIESDLHRIRKQNEVKCYTLPDGTTIINSNNVKRIIRR